MSKYYIDFTPYWDIEIDRDTDIAEDVLIDYWTLYEKSDNPNEQDKPIRASAIYQELKTLMNELQENE